MNVTACQVHEEPKHLNKPVNVNTEVTATANASMKTEIQKEADQGVLQAISPKISEKTASSPNNLEVFGPQTKSSSKEAAKNKPAFSKTLEVINPPKPSISKRGGLHTLDVTKLKSDDPESANNCTDLEVPTLTATYRKRSESFEEVTKDSLKVTRKIATKHHYDVSGVTLSLYPHRAS